MLAARFRFRCGTTFFIWTRVICPRLTEMRVNVRKAIAVQKFERHRAGGGAVAGPLPVEAQATVTSISTVVMLSGSIPPLTPETFLIVHRT